MNKPKLMQYVCMLEPCVIKHENGDRVRQLEIR